MVLFRCWGPCSSRAGALRALRSILSDKAVHHITQLHCVALSCARRLCTTRDRGVARRGVCASVEGQQSAPGAYDAVTQAHVGVGVFQTVSHGRRSPQRSKLR